MLYYRTPMFPDPAFDFPYNCFFVKRDYKLYNDICAHVSLRKQTIDLSLQRTSAKISDFQTTPQSECVRISKTTPSSDVRVRIFQVLFLHIIFFQLLFLHIFGFTHQNKVHCPIPVFTKF